MNTAKEEKYVIFTQKNIYWAVILIICVFIICLPLLSVKAYLADDIYFHLSRIEGIKEGLCAGQFPVRVHAYQFNGYGYLCGVFYPDIFLYIPAGLCLLGVPLNLSYNILCILLQLLTAFFSWYAFSLVTNRNVGALASVLYLSFWYHLFDIYRRAALGEVIAMAFLPLAIVSLIYLFFKDHTKWPLTVLAVSGVLQAHILSGIYLILICGCIFLYSLGNKYSKARKISICKAILFLVAVNSWYYVPFLYYYTSVDFIMKSSFHSIEAAGVPLRRLFYLLVSFGIPSLVYILIFIREYLKRRKFISRADRLIINGLICSACLLIFASTNKFPWHLFEKIPVVSLFVTALQFPWRLQEFAAIVIALLGGVGLVWFAKKFKHQELLLGAVSIIICAFSIFCIYHPQQFLRAGDIAKTGAPKIWEAIKFEEIRLQPYGDLPGRKIAPDYLYKDMNLDVLKEEGILKSAYADIGTINMHKTGTTVKVSYNLSNPHTIKVPLIYYAGYKASDDKGNPVTITAGKNHIMDVSLPKGSGEIKIWFQGLWYFQFFDILSLLSLIVLLGIIIKKTNIRLIRGSL